MELDYSPLTKEECRELVAEAVCACATDPAASEVVVLDTHHWGSTTQLREAGYRGKITAVQHSEDEYAAMCETLGRIPPQPIECNTTTVAYGDVYDYWLSLPPVRSSGRPSLTALVLDLCGDLNESALGACLAHRPPSVLALTTPAGRGHKGTQAQRERRLRALLEPHGYYIARIAGYRGGRADTATYRGGNGQMMVLSIAYRLVGAPKPIADEFAAHGHAGTTYHIRKVVPAPDGGLWTYWWGYGDAATWAPSSV